MVVLMSKHEHPLQPCSQAHVDLHLMSKAHRQTNAELHWSRAAAVLIVSKHHLITIKSGFAHEQTSRACSQATVSACDEQCCFFFIVSKRSQVA